MNFFERGVIDAIIFEEILERVMRSEAEEVSEKDFVSKMSKKLILLKPLNEFINRALTYEE